METLFLLFLLQVKHWYADFVIQTYMQTIKKGVWLHPVGISHSLDHIWGTLVALLIFNIVLPLSAITMLAVALLEGIIHYIIDFVKVKFGSKDMTKSLFWNQFGMDQLAHQLTYLGIAVFLVII
jgi:hypothetical protein